ncbi:hypothetical protein F511_32746 [Dorcoceras hygrometricum]|uniref:Uncharacterized protein ycf33 n=1 Tax=Dorcoceras hygrometricum TaxID=472368 RepID=A0A2Z7BTL9_9LAMI|nr:hypothetical protein F511_32746 [Dorcoceras hygrometricum]
MNILRLQLRFMHSNLHNPTVNSPRIIPTKAKVNPITSLPSLVNQRTERKSNHDDRTLINLASLKIKIHPINELSAVSSKGHSRIVFIGALSLGLAVMLMGFDDHQKALALGPEGPLVEEFWDNMRRYGLYALTVSTGAIYALLQPIAELLKNPISAILILAIIGGGVFIVSQVVSAMVGLSDFSYDYNY